MPARPPTHRSLPRALLCVGALLLLTPSIQAATGVDAQGQVWKWSGKNEPKAIPGLPAIQRLSNGPDYTLALDKDGQIWAWGANDSGQLGLNHFKRVEQPVQLMLPHRMVAIATGRRHALAVDQTGRIWSWGSNSHGQLGEGLASPFDLVRQPKPITTPFKTIEIAAGNEFSAALDQEGGVWLWGAIQPGKISQPQRVSLPTSGKSIAAAGEQLAITDTSGSVWLWTPPANPAKGKQTPLWLSNVGKGDALPAKALAAIPAASTASAPAIADVKKPEPVKGPPAQPTSTATSELIKATPAKIVEPTKKTAFKLVGHIRSGSNELGGVHIRGNGISCSDSDENGRYTCLANAGWTGNLTPSKPGYRFSPSSVTVPSVQDDDPDVQTFRAIYEP